MDPKDEEPALIQTLPYDVIVSFLEYTTVSDIIRFGSTCVQFNDFVKNLHSLWKIKVKNTVSEPIFKIIEKDCDGNWYNALKEFSKLQTEIYGHIIDMSAHFYKCNSEITLDDVKQFFNHSFSNGQTYYFTIYILQELLKKATKNIFMRIAKRPYTLTEIYYAKIVVRHLLHSYLTIKWVQSHVKNELHPEIVLNFFLQWVDPQRMHTDDDVDKAIRSITKVVEKELLKNLPSNSSLRQMRANGNIKDEEVIAAISHVMYKQRRMTPLSMANLETLNVIRVIDMACGHDVVIATVFQAIAKRFDVQCELIAFPNHLFLEFRGSQDKQVYKIELDSGKLSPKRTCPFSRNYALPGSYKYNPDTLLQYVISAFLMPMGGCKTWFMQNAIYLLDFLSTNPHCDNRYRTYLPYLLDNNQIPALSAAIDVRCLSEEHLKIITLLSYVAKAPTPPMKIEIVPKRRSPTLKFAVGMIVQHKVFEYMCVIRGWDLDPRNEIVARAETRSADTKQPYYVVFAVDQSERFIAEEHITYISRPSRLFHLEDNISKEFTHFNGFAYALNAYKQMEYPDDMAVSDQYMTRSYGCTMDEFSEEQME